MKKVLKILTLIMLIFTIIKISDTYAKYFAKAYTDTLYREIGQWIIKVNELDIYSEGGETVTFPINKFNNFSNVNAVTDKVSPGSKGYSDIVIDPTGTDVAVEYDMELDLSSISSLAINATAWLEIVPFNENGEQTEGSEATVNEITFERTGDTTYSGFISLADVKAENKVTIRCYLEWVDDENKNDIDSELGESADRITINVPATITIRQYIPEVEGTEGATEES